MFALVMRLLHTPIKWMLIRVMVTAAWKEVCEKHSVFSIAHGKSAKYPDGKAAAVWDEIQRLPPAMRRGDYGSQQKSLAEISDEEWDRAWRIIRDEASKEPPRVRSANWRRKRV